MATIPGSRRSLSIKVETFWRLRQMTDADDVSDAAFIEALIDARADEREIPTTTRDKAIADLPKAKTKPRKDQLPQSQVGAIVSQHFTF